MVHWMPSPTDAHGMCVVPSVRISSRFHLLCGFFWSCCFSFSNNGFGLYCYRPLNQTFDRSESKFDTLPPSVSQELFHYSVSQSICQRYCRPKILSKITMTEESTEWEMSACSDRTASAFTLVNCSLGLPFPSRGERQIRHCPDPKDATCGSHDA